MILTVAVLLMISFSYNDKGAARAPLLGYVSPLLGFGHFLMPKGVIGPCPTV
jgi:hypothetical protein